MIKKCPICDGKAEADYREGTNVRNPRHFVRCSPEEALYGCVRQDTTYATKREAIAAWNTRAALPSAQPSDVVEDVKPDPWGDKPDEYTAEIAKAHPMKTGDHATYTKAVKMVGNRHSKYGLVDLVNWLLTTQQAQSGDVQKLVEAAQDIIDGYHDIEGLRSALTPFTQNKGD